MPDAKAVISLAQELLGRDHGLEWMSTSVGALGGRAPPELLGRKGDAVAP